MKPSPQIEDFLRSNYLSLSNQQLASALGLGLTTTRTMMYSLGLKRIEHEYWTPEEVNLLQANYQTVGDVELSEMLTDHSLTGKQWTNKMVWKKRVHLSLHRTPEQIEAIRLRNYQAGRIDFTRAIAGKKKSKEALNVLIQAFGSEMIEKKFNRIKKKRICKTQKKLLRKALFESLLQKLEEQQLRQQRKSERQEAELQKQQSKAAKKETKQQVERQKIQRILATGRTREQLKAASTNSTVGKVRIQIDPKTSVLVSPERADKIRSKYGLLTASNSIQTISI